QEPLWRAVDIGAPVAVTPARPAVGLGAPVAILGAPRPAAAARVARGQADDRPPMPVGPGAGPAIPLPPPTPLNPPAPSGPFFGAPVEGGPVGTGGPVGSSPAPFENCLPGGGIGFDPGLAPLPGGVCLTEAVPCGMMIYANVE